MNVTSKANPGLTNDGELSLFFIGVGSAFSKNLNQTNALIVKGDDHLLIDCGTRCSQSLHEYGIPITGVQNFLITHSHADHIGGLEEVHLHGRYVQNKKPNMVIAPEYEQLLWSQSLRGGSEMSESCLNRRRSNFGIFGMLSNPNVWCVEGVIPGKRMSGLSTSNFHVPCTILIPHPAGGSLSGVRG